MKFIQINTIEYGLNEKPNPGRILFFNAATILMVEPLMRFDKAQQADVISGSLIHATDGRAYSVVQAPADIFAQCAS